MRCEEKFLQIYEREPEGVAFCPYRICTLGAHIDHQYGKINGFAIDYGVHIAYGKYQLAFDPSKKEMYPVLKAIPNQKNTHIIYNLEFLLK